MKERKNISSGAIWEDKVGYSRAVKIGNIIAVSGTTAIDENNNIIGKKDAYKQSIFILKKIEHSLSKFGAEIKDVIRTRIFVTNIDDWDQIGKAHGEFFKMIKPASTMVEVSNLIDTELLVEIEVEAVIYGE